MGRSDDGRTDGGLTDGRLTNCSGGRERESERDAHARTRFAKT